MKECYRNECLEIGLWQVTWTQIIDEKKNKDSLCTHHKKEMENAYGAMRFGRNYRMAPMVSTWRDTNIRT